MTTKKSKAQSPLAYHTIIIILEVYIMHSQIKIHRFDSEKTTSPINLEYLPRSNSLSVMLGASQKLSDIPEEDVNSSVALRKLKKINESKEMLRGRLSVLQIQDHKQEWKTIFHQQTYAFLQRKREQAQQVRKAKAELALARQREKEELQQRARKERALRKESLTNVRKQISKAKLQDYKQVKQRRGEIEKSIQEARKEEALNKKVKQERIREYERIQRTSVSKYRQNKMVEAREEDSKEARGVSRMRSEKTLEVKQLQKLQLLMIHKQNNSRMSCERLQMRLKEMMSKGKQEGNQTPASSSNLSLSKKRGSQKEIAMV